jgi:hypothetical protein
MPQDWKLVAVWVDTSGKEEEEEVGKFDTHADAVRELQQYVHQLGAVVRGKALKALRIDGDYLRAHLQGK